MCTLLCRTGKIVQEVTKEETFRNGENLKNILNKHICTKNAVVLLYLENNVHIPAFVLSFKNSGHIFVPIDTLNSSKKDIDDLIFEANIQYVISRDSTSHQFQNLNRICEFELKCEKFILWGRNYVNDEIDTCFNENILCIIPSSGTTGRRKLIKIEKYCILQNVDCLSKIFNLKTTDVVYFGTSLTFDPFLVELFLALNSGATLLIAPEKIKLNAEYLFRTLFPEKSEYAGVTFLQTVPSLFLRWSEKQIRYILNKSTLKNLALGGEQFPMEILRYERKLRIFNLYGITEYSCWATTYEINQSNRVFLGEALEETFLAVKRDDQEIQEGVGELCIGSLTRHCHLFEETEKVIWRNTGDIVSKNGSELEYLGRRNRRVKRLGHQIFLNEIEKRVYEKINLSCRCIFMESSELLLFISIPTIFKEDKERILDKIRVTLLHTLPTQEFPDFIDITSNFPINTNGKIDEKSLIKLYTQSNVSKNIGKSPCDIFITLLIKYSAISLSNIEKVKDCTFFELGGDSILFVLLTRNLSEILEPDLPSKFYSLLYSESIGNVMNFLEKNNFSTRNTVEDDVKGVTFEAQKTFHPELVQILWKQDLKGCIDSSPLIFKNGNKTLIAVGSFSNIFAIFNEKGEVEFLGEFKSSIGSQAEVSPCSNYVYFGCFDGNLFCISVNDREIIWTYETEDAIKCTPTFCSGTSSLVFGSYDKCLHNIHFKSGKLIWKTNINESLVTKPLYDNSKRRILVTTLLGSCFSIDELNGTINWHLKLGSPIFGASCLTFRNELIAADVRGKVHVVDLISTNEKFSLDLNTEIYSSSILFEDYIILCCRKGFIHKLKIHESNSILNEGKRVDLGEPISTSPCVFKLDEKTLIAALTTNGNFYLLNFNELSVLSVFKCSGDVFSSPIFFEKRIYFGCRDNQLYCMKILI